MQNSDATTDARPRFHLAFPVHDLASARAFYGGVLGCEEGRSSDHWIDFDFHGHQIVAHLSPEEVKAKTGDVDGHAVPVRHFGLILEWGAWEDLQHKLKATDTPFILEPYVRFEGKPGEQGTMFVEDPSGNALEFKTFREERDIFSKDLPS